MRHYSGKRKIPPVSEREMELYKYIEAYRDRFGLVPRLAEIGKQFGIGVKSVAVHIAKLQDKGMLSYRPYDRPSYGLPFNAQADREFIGWMQGELSRIEGLLADGHKLLADDRLQAMIQSLDKTLGRAGEGEHDESNRFAW